MTTAMFASLAARRKARYARRDRARSFAELCDWATLIAGFVAALAILVPVFIMIGYSLA